MKRRDFLKKAGVAAAASATLSPLMFASAQRGTFRFEMVTSWPTALDTIYGGATNTARFLREMTGGDVDIEVYPAGAQVGAFEVYDAVSSGAFAFGHSAPYYYRTRREVHSFFTSVPFGMNAQQQNAWFYAGNGQALMDELHEPDNLIAFPAGNTSAQPAGWFRREINTLADLRGITMRIPGIGGLVMSRVGATVENIPGGEIFLALETGRIDAAEWVGPYDDEILGFPQVAQFYYFPGWQEPAPTLTTYVNLDVWNDLPADIQEAIQVACKAANIQMLADYDARNPLAFQRIIDRGIQTRTLSEEILGGLRQATNELHDEFAAADPLYARVLEDYTNFKNTVRDYHELNEYAMQRYIYEVDRQNQG